MATALSLSLGELEDDLSTALQETLSYSGLLEDSEEEERCVV